MTAPATLVRLLQNTTIRELVRALERDGFSYRHGKGSQRVYRHQDRRRVVLHYHRANATLPPGTLGQVLHDAQWTEVDVRRLGLI